jgi:hypothetical protein
LPRVLFLGVSIVVGFVVLARLSLLAIRVGGLSRSRDDCSRFALEAALDRSGRA